MPIQFKYLYKDSDTDYRVHFSTKLFIQSKEYQLDIKVENGKAVKIMEGDCINSDGWFQWDQVALENELLELVNEVYEGELK